MSYEHTKIHSDWFESDLLCFFLFGTCLVTGEMISNASPLFTNRFTNRVFFFREGVSCPPAGPAATREEHTEFGDKF